MSVHVASRKFKLQECLGKGAFGEIYAGVDVASNIPVAIKLERKGAKYPQLQYEARIYNELRGVTGIARMHYCGAEGDFNVMVIDRLGDDMEKIRARSETKRLSKEQVVDTADRCLTILEQFHNRGFVHRDIKPDNILLDRAGKHMFLIDFGLSKRICDSRGVQIEPNNHKNLTGTPRYASVANHQGREQGRCDDLQSLGFVLIYLLTGTLPWKQLDDYSKIKREKQRALRSGRLFKDLPPFFAHYFNYVGKLSFDDKPDYARMRRMLVTETATTQPRKSRNG
jgi:serine/threonine protein kinase